MKRTAFPAPPQALRRRGFWRPLSVAVGLSLGVISAGNAQLPPERSLLLGGSVAQDFKAQAVDPLLPRGARVHSIPRPATPRRVCSLKRPVCVHGSAESDFLDSLQELETAYDDLVLVMGAPAPLDDAMQGGGPELDAYLLPDQPGPLLQVAPDAPRIATDAASAFCIVRAPVIAVATAVRCLTEALSYGLDAAESPALRTGLGSYMVWITEGTDDRSLQAVDDAQANPQIGLLASRREVWSQASALWWAFLDDHFAATMPGILPLSVFQLSRRADAAPSAPHPRWFNEPDSLDVVRAVLDGDRKREAELAMDFAVGRLFLGDRSDGAHALGLAWLGSLGRPRFDWVMPFSSLPRNVISVRAMEPYGSVYFWLEMDQVPPGAQIGVRVGWEGPVRFAWSAVGVDGAGRGVRLWEFPYLQTGTVQEKTLINLDGVAGIAFVGVNLGGVDLQVPFDPDFEPWEPHRVTLYLARLE